MGKENAMKGKRTDNPAKASTVSVDIGGIPGIYEMTMQTVQYIDGLSGNQPELSKAISSCTSIAIYSRYDLDDPFLVIDEMMIDCANHMFEMEDMFDPGTESRTETGCPHMSQCGGSDCSLCVFAPIRSIDLSNIKRAFAPQTTNTSPNSRTDSNTDSNTDPRNDSKTGS